MTPSALIRRAEALITDLRALQSSPLSHHRYETPSLHAFITCQMLIESAQRLRHQAQLLQHSTYHSHQHSTYHSHHARSPQ